MAKLKQIIRIAQIGVARKLFERKMPKAEIKRAIAKAKASEIRNYRDFCSNFTSLQPKERIEACRIVLAELKGELSKSLPKQAKMPLNFIREAQLKARINFLERLLKKTGAQLKK
ncbi:MAG: hypothetical protein Q7R70_02550 [Candidatus Diapherotrites archaeon]|nr:hypothetical protein [Candidatus Diapherotrites archaeon]